jgi:hypothetical protein
MQRLRIRRIVIFVAILLYIGSICLPAFSYVPFLNSSQRGVSNFYGWAALPFAPVAMLFMELAAFAWLANPIFLSALITYGFGKDRISIALAAAAIAVGWAFFPLSVNQPVLIPFSGMGEMLNYPKPMVGFYLWIASFLAIFLGALLSIFRRRRDIAR